MLVLGNSFSKYADALTEARRGRMAEWCALVRAQQVTNETLCGGEAVRTEREKERFANAFNDLSLHTFGPKLPAELWREPLQDPPREESASQDVVRASVACLKTNRQSRKKHNK